jgi:hypothetical protein
MNQDALAKFGQLTCWKFEKLVSERIKTRVTLTYIFECATLFKKLLTNQIVAINNAATRKLPPFLALRRTRLRLAAGLHIRARALLWAVRVAPSEVPSSRVARSPGVFRSRYSAAS